MHFTTYTKSTSFIWGLAACLILTASAVCNGLETPASKLENIRYSELQEIGGDCPSRDNCRNSRNQDRLDEYTCDCGSACTEFDTCCLDSKFRAADAPKTMNPDVECLPLYRSGIGVFMVEKCENGDSVTENLCKSNGEDTNDPFLMIPATSKATNVTYKNYFCLVCNEDTDKDQVVLWNMEIKSRSRSIMGTTVPDLKFDNSTGYWRIADADSEIAKITIKVEDSVVPFVKVCRAGQKGLISNCSKEWTDESVARKCAAYTALVGFKARGSDVDWYKNPHCALCNHKDLRERQCKLPVVNPRWSLNLNTFVGLFVFKDEETSYGRKSLYDKFSKKCRCNTRISYLKDGRCVSKPTRGSK